MPREKQFLHWDGTYLVRADCMILKKKVVAFIHWKTIVAEHRFKHQIPRHQIVHVQRDHNPVITSGLTVALLMSVNGQH